ncbi:aldo/keto reductase [uncultured Enterococcus sp.]|uniref:aldo/keto reductase n=1 Tax=uncultured Enterococcus sp. TaxID=167972 RepID=UPI002AA84F9E|nr:aldo/keto reductase [uncultured Enterococcus sp.]
MQDSYTLNNDITIPKVGFGTWMIDDTAVVQAVKDALEMGYRHIDTAQAYGNERGVGEAIRTAGVSREEIFVTSKIAAEHKTYEAAARSIDESLEKMGIDTIDMMIIHAPQPWDEFREANYDKENIEVWRALEDAYQQGKIRAIGLSNFKQHDLENILSHSTIKPAVNQVLAHIANTPFDLIRFCEEKGILIEAYSPIGHGALLSHPILEEMANKYHVSIPQLGIRYCLELGLLPLPKSATKAHIESNTKVDFSIDLQDMDILKNVKEIEDYGDSNHFPVYNKK